MARYSIEFLRFAILGRAPHTTVTAAEQALLCRLAQGLTSLVEVGVHEGATSLELCRVMNPAGTLYLVDPYVPGVRLERLLGLCFAQYVATRVVRPFAERVRFVRRPSLAAARDPNLLPTPADLVFVDAVHTYEAVREDFLAWRERLGRGGIIAFHDSRPCAARPDLSEDTGPVRLVAEIRRGDHGPWALVAEADSVSAFARS